MRNKKTYILFVRCIWQTPVSSKILDPSLRKSTITFSIVISFFWALLPEYCHRSDSGHNSMQPLSDLNWGFLSAENWILFRKSELLDAYISKCWLCDSNDSFIVRQRHGAAGKVTHSIRPGAEVREHFQNSLRDVGGVQGWAADSVDERSWVHVVLLTELVQKAIWNSSGPMQLIIVKEAGNEKWIWGYSQIFETNLNRWTEEHDVSCERVHGVHDRMDTVNTRFDATNTCEFIIRRLVIDLKWICWTLKRVCEVSPLRYVWELALE